MTLVFLSRLAYKSDFLCKFVCQIHYLLVVHSIKTGDISDLNEFLYCTNMVNMKCIYSFFLLVLISVSANSQGNESYAYKLKKIGGHYYFDAMVEHLPVNDIMIESGIPGLLIGDSLFHKCFRHLDLKDLHRESGRKIRLLNDIYAIHHILPLSCQIGNGIFTGNVFVLEGYNGMALPVQSLACSDSTKKYFRIDLANSQMGFWGEADWVNKADYRAFELEQVNGMPVIETDVSIVSKNGHGVIGKSKFILDFGNGSLLFLMKGNERVGHMIMSSGIEILEAKNKEGKVVSEGIYADSCTICDRKFERVSIGLTDKMKSFQNFSGLIGLKFFTQPVVLDFSDNKIFIYCCPGK